MEERWRSLDPYQPPPEDRPWYVARPTGQGVRLSEAIQAGFGGGRIALTGPAGVGKSTEILNAARSVGEGWFALPVLIDQLAHVPSIDPPTLILALSVTVARMSSATANARKLLLSIVGAPPVSVGLLEPLNASLSALGIVPGHRQWGAAPREASIPEMMDAFDQLLREARGVRRSVLLVDGLEKAGAQARPMADLLADLAERTSSFVTIVLGSDMVTGPHAHAVVSRYKIMELSPIMVEGDGPVAQAGLRFMREIFARRTGEDAELQPLREVVDRAARFSGGVPRLFLQLLQDAMGYAQIASRTLPDLTDLRDAVRDQNDNMRLLLTRGDLERIRGALGTDGTELEADHRGRYLTQGLLLARRVEGRVELVAHPLLRPLLEERAG